MRLFWNGFFVAIVLMVSFVLPARAFDLSQVDKTVRESLLSLATSAIEYADLLNAILKTSTTTQLDHDVGVVRITIKPAESKQKVATQNKTKKEISTQSEKPIATQVKYITREYYNTYLIQDPKLKDELLYLQNQFNALKLELDELKKRPTQVVNNYSSPAPVWNAISLTNKIDKLYGVTIDASPIGTSEPAEGHFTNLTANNLSVSNFTVDTVNADNISVQTVTSSTTNTDLLNVSGTSTLNFASVNDLIVNNSLKLLGKFIDAFNSAGNQGQVLTTTGTSTKWTDPSSLALGSINQHSDVNTASTTPTTGQVLKWDGNSWVPGDDINIYENNGTLSSNRNITQNGNDFSIDTDKLFISGVNNVRIGIGTNQPSSTLDIKSRIGEYPSFSFRSPYFNGNYLGNRINPPATIDTVGRITTWSVDGGLVINGFTNNPTYAAAALIGYNSYSGAASTPYVLAVARKLYSNGFIGAIGNNEIAFGVRNNANDLFNITGRGFVGIGTRAPSSPLTIINNGTTFEFDTVNFAEPEFRMTTSSGKRASFAFRYQGAGEAVVRFTKYADPVKNWAIGIQDNDNAFRIKQGFAGSGRLADYLNEYFIILPDGKVGIGTSTPTHRLSVEGDVNISGSININGNPISLNDLQDVKTDYANSSMYIGDGYPTAATGANNLTLGPSAGASLTSGFDNIALGEWALKSETIGSRNLAIGRWSLMSANTTYRNTAIGNGAMFQTQTGGENTSVGESALSATKFAQQNIAIGTRAGTATVVSGPFTNATSTRSIYIGVDSQAYDSNTDNEIVIGYGAKGLGSNTVVLGNDNIITTALKGKVGIGTTSPVATLDVRNTLNVGDPLSGFSGIYNFVVNGQGAGIALNRTVSEAFILLMNNRSGGGQIRAISSGGLRFTNNSSLQEWMRIDALGNVGIGTTAPDEKLTVIGKISGGPGAVKLNLRAVGGVNQAADFEFQDGGRFRTAEWSIKGVNDIFFQGIPASASGYTFLEAWASAGLVLGTGGNANPIIFQVNRNEQARLTSTGLGIGTQNPLAKLHIENGELWTFNNGNNPRIILGDNTTTGQYGWLQWDSANDYFRIDTSNSPALGLKLKDNTLAIGNVFPDPNQLFIAADNTNTRFVITKSGNVGVGTTTPDQKLQVNGGRLKIVNSGDLTWAGADSGLELGHFTGNYGYIQTYNSTPLRINPLGNSVLLIPNGPGAVGIGTASPAAKFNVNGGTLSVTNSGTSVRGGGVGIEMGSLNTFGYIQTYQSRPLQINPLGNNILLNPNTGRVGIGTTVPTEKLHVKGKILAEGETDAGAIMIKRTNATAGANFIGFIQFADYLNNIGPEIAALDTTPTDSAANADLRFYTDNRTPRLTIQGGTGNIGVGTIDPQTKFHVVSVAGEGNAVFERNEDSVNGAAVTYRRSRGDKINKTALQSGDVIGGFNAYGHDGTTYVRAASIRAFVDGTVSAGVVPGRIVFETADAAGTVAERLRISNNGNVGINTNAPTQKLDVAGNVRIQGALFDSLNSQGVQGQVLTVGATGNIEWKNPVSCVLGGASVQGNGTVNSSYGVVASVTRTNTGRYTVNFTQALTPGQYYAHLTKSEAAAVRDDVNIDVSSYGTNSLNVIIHEGDNGTAANVYRDRDFSITLFDANCTALSPIASSDRRLKTNIEKLNSKVALDKILRLQGVRFNWNTEKYPFRLGFDEKPEIGFVAQDVLEVVPEVVDKAPDGYYTLDYEKLTALTVEAIKELWQEITGVKEKVKEIEMLKRELCERDNSYSWCPERVNTSNRKTNNNNVSSQPKVDMNTNTNTKPINSSDNNSNVPREDEVKEVKDDSQDTQADTSGEASSSDAQEDSEGGNNEVDNNDQGNVDNVSDNTNELTNDSINNEAGENIDVADEDENVNEDSNLSVGSGEANIEEMNEDIELTDNNTEGSETSETVSDNTTSSSDESMGDAGLEESASETPVDVSDSDVSNDNNNDQTSVSEVEVDNSDIGA